MYIEKITGENIGPIEKIDLTLPFKDNSPKPIIIVGENGTGKSIFLSNIVDSLFEIAGKAYSDARKYINGTSYQYYKTITPIEIRLGEKYLFSYIKYKDENSPSINYVHKSGELTIDDFKSKVGDIPKIPWKEIDGHKDISINKKTAQKILKQNVLCYFGPDRYEKPFWMGDKYYETINYEHINIKSKISGEMESPILVSAASNQTLQWLLDIIIDSRVDIELDKNNKLALKNSSIEEDCVVGYRARNSIEQIMSSIIGEDVYFGLNFRNSYGARFNVKRKNDDSVIIPSFDALSTGQSALFNMFATIIRYADTNNIYDSIILENIKGIVVIDEIELHLHSKLQRDVLPKLIKLFPKVQFIITSHSPLFLLGMQEIFGDDGFEIYQMPQMMKIDAEYFSEFQQAYTYLTQTQEYQKAIHEALISKKDKMLVITEGSTDWKHMKAAYNALSNMNEYKNIFANLEFEFLEYEPLNSKDNANTKLEMGNKVLKSLCESIAKLNNSRKIVCIADRDDDDVNKKLKDNDKEYKSWGNNVYSFLIPIPEIRKETPKICIEHLYTNETIKREAEDRETQIKRRLFIGNEFDKRGVSHELDMICEKKGICGENSIFIIDGSSDNKVTKINNEELNIALPKMTFAKMILNKEKPFENVDFSNFIKIFEIIKKIYDEK